MKPSQQFTTDFAPIQFVPAGADRYGLQRGMGMNRIDFKVTPHNEHDMLLLENTFYAPGGPAKHLHYAQDEWFYAIAGSFVFEVGNEKLTLTVGDSLLIPRMVPHVWAYTGQAEGRILVGFSPAGQMEAFFRLMQTSKSLPTDPAVWHAHGMELLGPPLLVGQTHT
jgi:mannose-6-phosphate isomerase-like protein (cupin superfamily)